MCQFTIRLKDQDDELNKIKWIEPFAATASQHYYGQTLRWSRDNNGPRVRDQEFVSHTHNGDRVNIYMAQNAHATYFLPGDINSDIFAGCGTQIQYNSIFLTGWDRIIANLNPTAMEVKRLHGSGIYDWNGRWGQTYDKWWAPEPFHGPQSPKFRQAKVQGATRLITLASNPVDFHNQCRKTSQSTILHIQ
jgi:hypothetical protein